jgi:hypothetical protein
MLTRRGVAQADELAGAVATFLSNNVDGDIDMFAQVPPRSTTSHLLSLLYCQLPLHQLPLHVLPPPLSTLLAHVLACLER